MAIYAVQHIYHQLTNLPKDDVVNTIHFADGDGPDVGMAETLAGHVAACFYDADSGGGVKLESFYSGQISRVVKPTIKVYDAEEPGGPLFVAEQLAMRAASVVNNFPNEVALCASFRGEYGSALETAPDDADADTGIERQRARRRGRLYLGPFNTSAGDVTPGAPLMAAALNLVTLLRTQNAEMIAGDCSMVVFSRESTAGLDLFPVDHAWVDNEWDTQRRRGLKSTSRTTIDY